MLVPALCGLAVHLQGGPTGPLAPPRATNTAPWPSLTLPLPLRPGLRRSEDLGAAINRESSWAASGFDKGTLALAHIGPTGAGQKPARSATKRTGWALGGDGSVCVDDRPCPRLETGEAGHCV